MRRSGNPPDRSASRPPRSPSSQLHVAPFRRFEGQNSTKIRRRPDESMSPMWSSVICDGTVRKMAARGLQACRLAHDNDVLRVTSRRHVGVRLHSGGSSSSSSCCRIQRFHRRHNIVSSVLSDSHCARRGRGPVAATKRRRRPNGNGVPRAF